MARFRDRVVIVTGASRGLGSDVAAAFGREGAFVVVCFRDAQLRAKETLDRVRAAGGDGMLCGFDVRDAARVQEVFDGVLSARGRIDVLVNNAGIVMDAPFALMERASFAEVVDTNLLGAVHCCRAVVGPMMAARAGAIVNVASVAGLHASPGQTNYAAAKGGLLAFTATLATECAPRGVRVNAVVPGMLTLGMATRTDPRVLRDLERRIPAGRLGSGAEIAEAVLFLASDAASYVIGQSLVVDGGLTA